MPMYEFECLKCHAEYSHLCSSFDESGKYPDVNCPECGSVRKTKLLSVPNFQFTEPEGTSRWISESKGHDYRYKHNQPKVRKERAMAQAMSKMGRNPYNAIDDVSSGENFGEVK